MAEPASACRIFRQVYPFYATFLTEILSSGQECYPGATLSEDESCGKRLRAAIESDGDDIVEAAGLYADAVTAYRQLLCSSMKLTANQPQKPHLDHRSPNGV